MRIYQRQIEPDERLLKYDKWFFAPSKIFKVPFTGSWFYVSAKFDQTTITRIFIGFGLSFFDVIFWGVPAVPIIWEIGKFSEAGLGNDFCMGLHDGEHIPKSACKQGGNLVDFLGTALGVLIYVKFIS